MISWDALSGSAAPWLRLILSLRLLATASAIVLLLVHRVTAHDGWLIAAVSLYGLAAVAIAVWARGLTERPLVWALDMAIGLALVALSADWRSPFFLLSVITLVTPAVTLTLRGAVLVGLIYSLAFAVVAHFVGPDPLKLGSRTTVETLATHLTLPMLVAFATATVANALAQLKRARLRAERLSLDAERRRIAWELHDSAKARVHAAHLVLSALRDAPGDTLRPAIDQVLGELDGAAADMNTSLEELRSPLEGRDLHVALEERATGLQVVEGPEITVEGSVGTLGPLTAAHAYRIASEAVINAARHADASHIRVTLAHDEEGATVAVSDDGRGMPADGGQPSNGLRFMRSRAQTINADLRIREPESGSGTVVELHIPTAPAVAL